MIKIKKVEFPTLGTVNLNLNQQIILEYHGVLKIQDFVVKLTMIKTNKELFVIQSTIDEDIIKFISKQNVKSLN